MAATGDQVPPAAGLPAEQEMLADRTVGRKLLNGLISLAVLVALFVGLLLAVPGLHGVKREVTHMQGGWIGVAIGLEVLSCLGYVLAFLQVFERAPIRFGARVALTEQAFGAAVSLGGAGSVSVGAWMLISRGGTPARVAERSVVLFLLTSAVNAITLALAGLALVTGILPGPRAPLLSAVPAAVAVVVLAFFLALPSLIGRLRTQRLPRSIGLALELTATSVAATRRYLVVPDWRTIGALAYLWCDIGVLVACLAATGSSPPLASIVLAYQIGYVSNILPVPGNVGVLDGSLVGMLVLYGLNATTATAATVVYHAIALWIPATWGTVAFVILQRTRNRPLVLRQTRAERRAERAVRQQPPPADT